MKETFYFSHDYHARSDTKIVKLLQKEKLEGYGIFWSIVEMLYENDGYIDKDYESIAFELRTDCERIQRVVEDYGLFQSAGKKITSKSVEHRLRLRKGKSEQARQSAVKRWEGVKQGNANALPTQSERNAIKESKVKEIKIKENTDTVCFDIFWNEYPHKIGKPNALKKYKDKEHDGIIDGLTKWKQYWEDSNTEQRYIPHPATWLNQERWKDEPPEAYSNVISI